MAVISFWNNNAKETGQTLSTVAVATNMAIEHNNRILLMSTGFNDKTIENCFWDNSKNKSIMPMMGGAGLNSRIEGLVRILQSNKTSSNIVSNYAKVVFKNRLDILPSPTTTEIEVYNNTTKFYDELAKVADKDYDYVFIDVDSRMNIEHQKEILKVSDVIVVTMKQSLDDLNNIIQLKKESKLFSKNNILLLVGKYDKFSKYNIKNMTRFLREHNEISAIPYNTLYNEAAMEGKVADFFLRYRSVEDVTDRNMVFTKQTRETCENILNKLQELQMRI